MPDHSRFSRYLMPDSEEYQAATLGSSTMAKRLRAGVAAAAADAARRPVCVQGEPGKAVVPRGAGSQTCAVARGLLVALQALVVGKKTHAFDTCLRGS